MKTTNHFIAALASMLLLFSAFSFSQENKIPEYYTVTTMYMNSNTGMTLDEWKAGEKEYMEKVTSKNEYILSASYFGHYLTPNSNEILYVQSYPNWEAIDKASARSAELEKLAWPDETNRKAFLKKMGSAFTDLHSDEIYAILPDRILVSGELPENAILYVRKNKRAFPKDGTSEEFMEFMKRMNENVIGKNEYIKGYYPSHHSWGSDRRDFMQAFYLDSLGDLDNMFDKNDELMKTTFTEEEGKAMGKYFESHGDYIYGVIKL
ncbi:MAG: hypothetical protein ACM31G_09065 [Flavobacteriales bacterium]